MGGSAGRRAALLAFVGACGRIDFDPLSDATDVSRECRAQRVVQLVAGNGGLGWFTLVWPAPKVISGYQPAYAYDDPALATQVLGDPHPLYARRNLWAGAGSQPHVSAYVAGANETHTSQPDTVTAPDGIELLAAASTLQTPLNARVPVLRVGSSGPYGPAPGAATALTATSVAAAVTALGDPSLAPDPTLVASWHSAGAPQRTVELAEGLAFAANAFRSNAVAAVQLEAMRDDPHGAFDMGYAASTADDITLMLDSFYRTLATIDEPTCGHDNAPLSLADNVVLVVDGDTPKNFFSQATWGDIVPSINMNVLYMRANGFTVPGWFGDPDPVTSLRFDPTTGSLSSSFTGKDDAIAAHAATLYAVARGDAAAVGAITNAQYQGLVP